jgi:hypothetical protein
MLKAESSSWPLWTRQLIFLFCKRRRISWPTERLHSYLCSMKLFSHLNYMYICIKTCDIHKLYFNVNLPVLRTMPWWRRPIGGDETQLDAFQTLALGGDWFQPRSGHVTTRREIRYLLYRRLSRSWSHSGCMTRRKIVSYAGNQTPVAQPIRYASSLIYYKLLQL